MKIQLIGRVMDVGHSNGMNYVTFNDTEVGGQVKLSIPGAENSIPIDSKMAVNAVIKPGIGKFGLYLRVESLTNLESDMKGDK